MKDLVNHRKLPNGRMVLYDKPTGQYYDPVTDTYLNNDEAIQHGLMENESTNVDQWIEDNKSAYKEKYGKKWEPNLYQSAWNRFGKKVKVNESMDPSVKELRKEGFKIYVSKINPKDTLYEIEKGKDELNIVHHKDDDKFHIYDNSRSMYKFDTLEAAIRHKFKIVEHEDTHYTDKWEDAGFNIEVSDVVDGIQFTVEKDDVEVIIIEPEVGVYETDGKRFPSFDKAIEHHVKSHMSDISLHEKADLYEIIERMSMVLDEDISTWQFFVSNDEKSAIKKAFELGKQTPKYEVVIKGKSDEIDDLYDLMHSYGKVKKKIFAAFEKGRNEQK